MLSTRVTVRPLMVTQQETNAVEKLATTKTSRTTYRVDIPISGCKYTHHLMYVKVYCKCSAVAEMGDRLVTIDMGRKVDCVQLLAGAGSPN